MEETTRFEVLESSSGRPILSSEVRKPSKARVLLPVVLVLLILLLTLSIVFIVLYAQEKNDDSRPTQARATSKKVCSSPECVISSSDILKKLDTSVKPCDDFYQYSCGGFVKNGRIRDDEYSLNSLASFPIDYSLKELLEDEQLMLNYSKDPNSAVYKAFTFYKSCMNENEIAAEARWTLDFIIKYYAYGYWYINLNQTTAWEDSWILEKVIAKVNVDLHIKSFIGFSVTPSIFNTSQVVVGVSAGSSAWDRHSEEKFLISTQSSEQVYCRYLETIFELLVDYKDVFDVNQTDPYKTCELAITFSKLKKSINVEEQAAKVGYKNMHKLMTIDELNNFTSFKFNWTIYFEEVFRGTNKSIGPNQKLLVTLPDVIKNIIDFLHQQPKWLLSEAILWNIIADGFINSLPTSFRQIKNQYLQSVSGRLDSPIPRWRTCTSFTNTLFKPATTLLYANKYFSEDTIKKVENLILEVKEQFINGLEEQTWMDQKTRDNVRTKLNEMKKYVGYPSFIKDSTKRNKLYEGIHVSPSHFFENQLNIYNAFTMNSIQKLGKPPDTRFSYPPVEVNAAYDLLLNKMYVPMGIIKKPFYDGEQLKALNYGALGAVIGHEITHGFDVSGSQFDGKGNVRSWWTKKSLHAFKKRVRCIAEQYNNVSIFGHKVNGNKTLSENIADNGGLKYAFRAYRKWRDTNGREDKLPALKFTNDQLFFISYAQLWCIKHRHESAGDEGEHAPDSVRARVSLSNFPEFHRAFGCKLPTKTCTVW